MDEDESGLGGYGLRQPSLVPLLLSASNALSNLPDELIRRLSVYEPAANDVASTSGRLGVRLFCQERHEAGDGASAADARGSGRSLMVVNKWRQKEKLKTTAVALVLCLNIGVDPPDVVKISPCARLECWVDPLSMQPAKALETIGKNLQAQYERWQPRAKYKMHLDPTLDDVKKLAASCRRTAKAERVLFHYNGHGVPRPTPNGEIWVFNSRYTQYIPLSIYELQAWLGTPAIYVLDCSAAGLIINSLKTLMDARTSSGGGQYGGGGGSPGGSGGGIDPMREIIVLAACGANELLPQNPDLPADVFTACLTTPIKVALRWFCSRSLLRHDGLTKELIDRIPGRQTDRKTPLGELNWIFTAITDTIAWNSLPRATFQKLFRQDLLVASLFRNFLLAERILAAANATPVSWPRLPPTHQHPMWQAWDMAAEMCLLQLPALLADPAAEFTPSTFFSEQLTAFELWLAHGSADKKPPEQLPIVLQVLLSQVHRLRALVLLGRFLDMGLWAVDLALSVGIFPYVLKLLQTTSSDLRTTLVFIWAKILALDTSCQADLVKDGGHLYFLKYLDAPEPGIDHHSRAQAVFVLATVCDGHPRGQALCYQANLLGSLLRWLQVLLPGLAALEAQQAAAAATGVGGVGGVGAGVSRGAALLVKWCCLALGRLVEDNPEAAAAAMRDGAPELLSSLLGALDPELRAAAVFALGCLIHSQPRVGAGGAALQDARFSQLGASVASSSAASLAMGSLAGAHGSSAALGAAGAGVAGSSASLGGVGGDPAGAASAAAAAALLEASINSEQSIAALLLRANVVYDASALVRSELAGALSRLVRGHMPLLEDAILQLRESVSYQQRKVADLLRAYQRQASMPQHMPSGEAAAGGDGAMAATSSGSSGSSGGVGGGGSGAFPTAPMAGRQQQGGEQQPGGSVAAAFHSPAGGSWADVPGAGGAPGGGLYVPDGSSVAAAAAAAGVGGGPGQTTVYTLLLETVLALATDPSPRVARLGRRVLGLAQMELAPLVLGSMPAPPVARSTSGPGLGLSPSSSVGGSIGAGSAGAGPYGGPSSAPGMGSMGSSGGGGGVGASLGSLTSKLVKGGRSWRSGFASGAVGGGVGGGAGMGSSSASMRPPGVQVSSAALSSTASVPGSTGGSPPGSPNARDAAAAAAASAAAAQLQGFARQQYVLRSTAPEQQQYDGADGVAAASPSRMSSGAAGGGGSGGGDDGGLSPQAGGSSRSSLPPSAVYASSCEYFSRPMLEPQASAWRELEAHKVAPWTALQDGTRKAQRLREMEAARTRCRGATNPRLREQVSSIETGADSLTSLVFHSFHLLLVTADQRGYVRVQNAADGSMLNTFHVTNGASLGDPSVTPSSLVYLRQLNEAESNLLLTCAADGAVRVWRSYLHSGNQRMAAAWQAVPMRQPAAPVPWNASFALADATRQYWLYAAGGSHPDVLQRWDLHSEMCAQQIAVRSSSSGSSCPVAIEHLSVSQNDPHLLLAGCSDQMLRLFDVRAGATPALAVHAGRSPLAGMVLEPCGRAGAALTGSTTGELRFLDLRLAGAAADGSGDPTNCIVRSVQAHSTGGMSVLAAHPNAPLLATATAASASVVKVWTDAGDVVGAIKSAAPQRMAPVTAMAWHPYNLYLGAGGRDSVASVFIVDHGGP